MSKQALTWRFNDGLYFAHTPYGHFTLEQGRGQFHVKFNPAGLPGEAGEQDMGSYKTLALAKASAARDHRALSGLRENGGRRTATKRKRSYAKRSASGRAKKRRTLTRLRHVRATKRRGYGVMRHAVIPRSYAKEVRAADTPGARFTKCWECDKEDWCLKRKLNGRDLSVHLCEALP